ncbi:MAG: alpha/beta hydrolase [Proteobacteria bacterium]|nr:alpha/beta hydrolase [Pseudomonadota bacterium]
MKASRSEFLTVRGLRYHLRHWGEEGAPKLFMLHGWMDVSASFQFVVDSLQRDWHVIAPDWRGYGLSQRSGSDTYWFADYLGDLDVILQHYAPGETIKLLGHSMGGNIACTYAGVRPERIHKLVNLEGFGMPPTKPEQAPARYAKWLDALHDRPPARGYASLHEVMARLQKTNPRLSDARASFLAANWAAQNADGRWDILGDPAHKQHSPLLYRIDETLACWQAIRAPVLWVEAVDTDIWRWMGPKEQFRDEIDRRIGFIQQVKVVHVSDAGHMLHHDQPELVAQHIEAFLEA